MKASIEELRRRRQAIADHLAWLDSEIAARESAPSATQTASETADQAPPAPTSEAPQPESSAPATSQNRSQLTTGFSQRKTASPKRPEAGAGPNGAGDEGDAERALKEAISYASPSMDPKVGCLVFFFVTIGLFLFFLFGLPYLLK